MLKSIQTYILISVIAVLIWVLAEGESVRVLNRTVDVQIRPDPGASRVYMIDPAQEFNGSVSVRLEGSTASLDAIANELRAPIVLTPDLLGLPSGAGKFGVDLKTALRAHPIFAERGVTPLETVPQSVTLEADDVVTRTVRVAVAQPDDVLIQGVLEPTPDAVVLRLPSRLASRLTEESTVTATIDPAALSQVTRGRQQTISGVRLELPGAIRSEPMAQFARAEPGSVAVTLTVQDDSDSIRIASVPVTVRMAALVLPEWDVQIAPEDQTITDVKVTGPRDLIKQIADRKVSVFAVIPLDWQQLDAAALSGGPATFDVGFTLSSEAPAPVKFDAADRSVRLTVKRRALESSPATPPG